MSIDGNVKAYARSKDPENWSDSDVIDHTYTVEMIVLDLVLDFEKPSYNYVELGGPIMPPVSAGGSVVADPVLAAPGRALITNVDLLPLSYQNSDTFKVMWTYDNVDPVGAPGEHVSRDFTRGFVPVEIPLDLALFTIQPELPIKATTISPVYPYITSSGIVKAKLEIEKITLRQPLAPVLSGGYLAAQQVVLDFDTSGADMPVGARIYYTLDGSDPGVDTDGEPLTGVEYTGAFSISTSKKLNARVYAPKDYTDWFEPSELYESRLVVPGSEDLYVGGDMSMGSMRGIIRLTPGGTMDATFNPGTGVGEGSYVNSVLMHNAASGVLVGGNFESMNGDTRYGITRLNYNGSVDLSFDAQLE